MSDLDMSDLDQFRRETRAWLEANCPPEMRLPGTSDDDTFWGGRNTKFSSEPQRVWFERMRDKGWTVPDWPREYGGGGLDAAEAKVLREEMSAIGARSPLSSFGIWMLGPALLKYGTDAQKKEYLPKIAAGLIRWCQGYSEPNAGSDLANVRTQARLANGKWRVNGQKTWTSWGLWADHIFVLARSEAGSRGSAGLSFLLMNMDQPGVTRRPIRQITGENEFAEVFFNDAEASEEDLVGAAGQGWKVAMTLLGFERGVSTLVQQMHFANEVAQVVSAALANGRARDPLIRQKIADAWTGLQIMKFTALRLMSDTTTGAPDGSALTSKLYWSRWHRALGDLAMEVLGAAGEAAADLNFHTELQHVYLRSRSDTIYAGSSQIQRNIIAERGLGLPREPRGNL